MSTRSDSSDQTVLDDVVTLNGNVITLNFWFCFEDMYEVPDVELIPTRNDQFIELSKLIALSKSKNLVELTDGCIKNLYSFAEGVQFLWLHKEELYHRGLLIYMFASPFVTEEKLIELIYDPFIIENCNDNFICYLANNPNIYE